MNAKSTSPLINKDVHEIFVQFAKDIAPNLGEYKGGKSEQQIIDFINREVVKARIDEVGRVLGVSPVLDIYLEKRKRELNQRKSD